jgi:hypothetical protein
MSWQAIWSGVNDQWWEWTWRVSSRRLRRLFGEITFERRLSVPRITRALAAPPQEEAGEGRLPR